MEHVGSAERLRSVAARRGRARRLRQEAERASTEWPAFAPQTDLGTGPLGEAQAADREIARMYALRARRLAEFAASRPATVDRAQGEPGAMSPERWERRPDALKAVSEWATSEASIGLSRSQPNVDAMLVEALTLTTKLPGALMALEAGMLTPDHLRPLLEHVATIGDEQLRREIEAEVLRWVAARADRRTITAPPQLRERVLRVVTRRDARNRAQQAIRALKDRGVFRLPEDREGLGALGIVASTAEIAALRAALEAYADAVDDPDDTRTRGEKMIGCLLDLVLRPGESGLPPVQVLLTLVAPLQTLLGGDTPAELNGCTTSAEAARQLLNVITGAGLGEGALAELRALAAEPPAAAPGSGNDGDRWADDPGFEAWEADREGRSADGDHDDPDPMPDDVWRASVEARLASGEIDLELDRELAAARERWDAEFAAGRIVDPDPPDGRGPTDDDAPPEDPLPTSGWWAAADRAVADARAAQVAAQAALWRAGRRVRTAERADRADASRWSSTAAGRVAAAETALDALAAATEADREALSDLLERSAGGGLAERPRIALVDAVTGALVSLTDLPGLRRAVRDGNGLGAPPPTDGYRPGAALDRFIRHRDRRCRFPGCRRPVSKGELDHRVRWPDGPTDVTNLAGFCTGDHRGKHQAPGFRHAAEPDGTLVVTTPSGITATTEPPPY